MSESNGNFLVNIPALSGNNGETNVRRISNTELSLIEGDDRRHLQHKELGIDKYSGELLPIGQWDVVRRNAVDAIATCDHTQICAQLESYAESDNTAHGKDLKILMGENAPSRTGDVYDRYRFIWCGTTGKGKNRTKTWYVERFNPLKRRMKKSS